MHPFEEEDHEPVAVVRTLSDFALALTLIVLMLIGTHSAAETKRLAESHAASLQKGGHTKAELTLLLKSGSRFSLAAPEGELDERTATSLAASWIPAHSNAAATIVLQFPPQTLAGDLHRALLELQTAFGTNLARIETVPQS